jgi:hypothetical protein
MIQALTHYLCIAVGFYAGAAFVNVAAFQEATLESILYGIVGALFFPVLIGFECYEWSRIKFIERKGRKE